MNVHDYDKNQLAAYEKFIAQLDTDKKLVEFEILNKLLHETIITKKTLEQARKFLAFELKEAGVKQKELANLAGITQSTLSNAMNGRKKK